MGWCAFRGGVLVRRSRDESGVALVVALLVTLVVFLLTTAILADALHNVVGAADSRERLTAFNAAEAGVAWYSRALESTGASGSALTSLKSSPWTWSAAESGWTLDSWNLPASSEQWVRGIPGRGGFTLTARYWTNYDSATDNFSGVVDLLTATDESAPPRLWVELISRGQACRSTALTSCGAQVSRSVRAVIELAPLKGSLNGAYAGIYICELGNRFTITGPASDVYLLAPNTALAAEGCPGGGSSPPVGTSGNILVVTSGQFTTSGNVYVLNGGVLLKNTSRIAGSLWAKGGITLGNGGLPRPDAVGVPGPCSNTVNASVLVCGNATSLSPSGVTLTGTARVLGTVGTCSTCTLPGLTFAKVTQAQAEAGFPASTYPSVADLSAHLKSPSDTGKHRYVVSTCATPMSLPTGTLYLANDLAVISPCGYTSSGRVEIRRAATTPAGVTPTLYLITGWSADACQANNDGSSTDIRNISVFQNFDASAVRTYLYTPCRIAFRNQVTITGQILARTLYAQGQTTINTVDLKLASGGLQPGYVQAFASRVLSIREV